MHAKLLVITFVAILAGKSSAKSVYQSANEPISPYYFPGGPSNYSNPNGYAKLAPLPGENPNGQAPLAPLGPSHSVPLAPLGAPYTPLAPLPGNAAANNNYYGGSTFFNPNGDAPLAPLPDPYQNRPSLLPGQRPIQPGVVNQTRPIYPNLHNAGYNPNYNNGNMDIGHFSNVNPSPSYPMPGNRPITPSTRPIYNQPTPINQPFGGVNYNSSRPAVFPTRPYGSPDQNSFPHGQAVTTTPAPYRPQYNQTYYGGGQPSTPQPQSRFNPQYPNPQAPIAPQYPQRPYQANNDPMVFPTNPYDNSNHQNNFPYTKPGDSPHNVTWRGEIPTTHPPSSFNHYNPQSPFNPEYSGPLSPQVPIAPVYPQNPHNGHPVQNGTHGTRPQQPAYNPYYDNNQNSYDPNHYDPYPSLPEASAPTTTRPIYPTLYPQYNPVGGRPSGAITFDHNQPDPGQRPQSFGWGGNPNSTYANVLREQTG